MIGAVASPLHGSLSHLRPWSYRIMRSVEASICAFAIARAMYDLLKGHREHPPCTGRTPQPVMLWWPWLCTGWLLSQADRAGQIHYWMAMAVLALAGLHALGALKHHFLDRDDTLRRMLGPRPRHLTDRQE